MKKRGYLRIGCSRLPSSMSPEIERRIKQLYATRMQIEETLRDNKPQRCGFGLRYTRSRFGSSPSGALAPRRPGALVFWLVGLAGRARDLARSVQANTIRYRTVLSSLFVGRVLIPRRLAHFTQAVIEQALLDLRALITNPNFT